MDQWQGQQKQLSNFLLSWSLVAIFSLALISFIPDATIYIKDDVGFDPDKIITPVYFNGQIDRITYELV